MSKNKSTFIRQTFHFFSKSILLFFIFMWKIQDMNGPWNISPNIIVIMMDLAWLCWSRIHYWEMIRFIESFKKGIKCKSEAGEVIQNKGQENSLSKVSFPMLESIYIFYCRQRRTSYWITSKKFQIISRYSNNWYHNYFVLKYIWKSLYLGQDWADHAVTNFVGTWLWTSDQMCFILQTLLNDLNLF